MGWPSINPSYFHVNYREFTYDLPMKRWWFWPIPIWFPYENPTFFTMPGAPPAQPHRQSSPAPSQRCLEITIAMGVPWDAMVPSGYLTKSYWKWPIYSEFSHWKWWFSMAMLTKEVITVIIYLLKIVIFQSYVSLPEGNHNLEKERMELRVSTSTSVSLLTSLSQPLSEGKMLYTQTEQDRCKEPRYVIQLSIDMAWRVACLRK